MSTLTDEERHELSLLLPWYANGTLDADDSRRVEAALAEDVALAREFDLVLEDQAAMIELVSEEEVPVSIGARFTAALNAEPDQGAADPAPRGTGESWLGRIMAALSPTGPRAYAAVAAVVIFCVPAYLVVSGMTGDPDPGQYQTASGDAVEPAGLRFLVRVNADATWAEVDAFLTENRGQIVRGPNADGFYEMVFEESDTLAETIDTETELFDFTLPAN